MPSLNRVECIGHLGKDPEMRFTANGDPVTTFSVACSSKYKDKESTEWFNVVAWGKLAETCNQYLTKGQLVYVEGRLQTRTWQSDDGQKHYKAEVIASKVLFLGGRKGQIEQPAAESEDDGELPF